MTTIPPTELIRETNFHNAWMRAIKYVIRDGMRLTIGDTIHPKPIRDACITFELTGNAITQIEAHELHPQFPFQYVEQYIGEFTRQYLEEYIKRPINERFSYVYFERLAHYHGAIDQMSKMRENLSSQITSGISSNRHESITWIPETDIESRASPCLQRIWVRWLGGYDTEVHLDWRSRDLYSAWQVNIVAVIDMINREVIKPNNCRIVKIIDHNDSIHIYDTDYNDIENGPKSVKYVPVNPQMRR